MWLPLLVACFCALAGADETTDEEFSLRSPASVEIHYGRSSESRLEVSVEAFGTTHNLVLKEKVLPPVAAHELVFGPNGTIAVQDVPNNDTIVRIYEDESKGAILYMNDKNKLEGMVSDAIALKYENEGHVASDISVKKTSAFCGNVEHGLFDAQARNNNPINDGNRAVSYTVEMLSIIDSSLYEELGNDAISYLVVYWRKVSQIFKDATGSVVNIRFKGYLLSTPNNNFDSQMMFNWGSDWANIDATLYQSSRFLSNYRRYFTQYDLVHLMTNRKWYSINDDYTINTSLLGVAFGSKVCEVYEKVGLARDNGKYSGVITTTHEIGHNLGAFHDGEGYATKCGNTPNLIMYFQVGSSTVQRFSQCSLDSFNWIYNQDSARCLRYINN